MSNAVLANGLLGALSGYQTARSQMQRNATADEIEQFYQQHPLEVGQPLSQGGLQAPPQPAPQGTQSTPVALPSAPDDYGALADSHADRTGLDRGLVRALVQQESAWDPTARSHAGAYGLTQAMPATWAQPGFGVTPGGDINDPNEQMRFGTDYFKAMLDRYNGDVPKALAAYNAGAGRVDDVGGVPNIPETQDYVRRITANAGLGVGPQAAPDTGATPSAPPQYNVGLNQFAVEGANLYRSQVLDAYRQGRLEDPATVQLLQTLSNDLVGRWIGEYQGPDPSTPQGGVAYAEYVGQGAGLFGQNPLSVLESMSTRGAAWNNVRTNDTRNVLAGQQEQRMTEGQRTDDARMERELQLRESEYDDGEAVRQRMAELELVRAIGAGQVDLARQAAADLGWELVEVGEPTTAQSADGRAVGAVQYSYRDAEGNIIQADTAQRAMDIQAELTMMGLTQKGTSSGGDSQEGLVKTIPGGDAIQMQRMAVMEGASDCEERIGHPCTQEEAMPYIQKRLQREIGLTRQAVGGLNAPGGAPAPTGGDWLGDAFSRAVEDARRGAQ